MKLQFFAGTIWGTTEILQGGRVSARKTALPSSHYVSILELVLMPRLILMGQKAYEANRHLTEMMIQEEW